MKNIITKSILSLTSLIALSACGQAPQMIQQPMQMQQSQIQTQNVFSQQLLIKFAPEAHRLSLQRFYEKYNLQVVDFIPHINTHVVRANGVTRQNLERAMVEMQNDRIVNYVERNIEVKVGPVYDDMFISPIFNR